MKDIMLDDDGPRQSTEHDLYMECRRLRAALKSADLQHERVTAQRDVADARCERALTSLRSLVRQLERIQGYSTHSEQTELRDARALLVEAGR